MWVRLKRWYQGPCEPPSLPSMCIKKKKKNSEKGPQSEASVEAMKFVEGLTILVNSMGNPAQLFKEVEALGFRHLDMEITSGLSKIGQIPDFKIFKYYIQVFCE